MKVLDYKAAHKFVDNSKAAFWEGWTLICFKPQRNAWLRKDGLFRNGVWGIGLKVSPNSNGEWVVPMRFAKNV